MMLMMPGAGAGGGGAGRGDVQRQVRKTSRGGTIKGRRWAIFANKAFLLVYLGLKLGTTL